MPLMPKRTKYRKQQKGRIRGKATRGNTVTDGEFGLQSQEIGLITSNQIEASNVKSVNDINAVKVELEDDGRVIIYHKDKSIIEKTKQMIENVVKEVEEGKIYVGKVVKIEDFGCFVELWPGCEGLVQVLLS